ILLPVDTVESLLAEGQFRILDRRGSRFEGDRTSRVALDFGNNRLLAAKWAEAPRGGDETNNSPRYELAAYRIQSLFLEPYEYVVPPTVARAFPLDWYRTLVPRARATFRGTESVVVVLQYWLFNVTPDGFWDEDRFARDTVYARHLANFNILTYLIRHNDENEGNYLVSSSRGTPRVFSVDNGLSFDSEVSDVGAGWRSLNVDRLPGTTVDRLRALTEDQLIRRLETVAEFRVREDNTLVAVTPGPALSGSRGIRQADGRIQFGLTRREIRDVWRRLQRLLDDVDDGDLQVF
ncbi:MAG: hypothetical protein ACOCUW_00195, partial [Gemmatimonadota bacterium]